MTLRGVWDAVTGFFAVLLGALLIIILALIPFVILGLGLAIAALIVWWILKLFGVIAIAALL